MDEFPEYDEEEEEEEVVERFSTERARYEVIEFLLRRYGGLKAQDIARTLGCRVTVVRQTLRQLESAGRVKRAKLGRTNIWYPADLTTTELMYF